MSVKFIAATAWRPETVTPLDAPVVAHANSAAPMAAAPSAPCS